MYSVATWIGSFHRKKKKTIRRSSQEQPLSIEDFHGISEQDGSLSGHW